METSQNERYLQALEEFVEALHQGKKPVRLDPTVMPPAARKLAHVCNRFRDSFSEILHFVRPFCAGDLVSFSPADEEGLSRIFVEFETNLKQLATQIDRLAAGEFDRPISLAGDFATSLKTLAVRFAVQEQSLQQKRREIDLLLDKTRQLRQENRQLVDLANQPTAAAKGGNGKDSLAQIFPVGEGSYHSISLISAANFLRQPCKRFNQPAASTDEVNAIPCHTIENCLCFADPQIGACPIEEAISSARPFLGEAKQSRPDGTTQELEMSLFPLLDDKGNVQKLVRISRDISHQSRSLQEVHQLAYYDPLTKLPNRTLFIDRLNQSLAQVQRHGDRLALIYLDLDDFKAVNDNFGHHNGDRLLQELARRMKTTLRESDSVARWGGDEFLIALPDIDDEREIVSVVGKILAAVSQPVHLFNAVAGVSCSIGVAIFPDDGLTSQALLNHADLAMYAAKKAGKNNYHFFSEEMHRAVKKRTQLEADLGFAMKNGEFFLAYQPQFDVPNNRICGAEALLRWQTVDGGVLEPGTFLKVADETGMLLPIGQWVLRTACRQLVFWQRQGFPHLRMGVNLSQRQLLHPQFLQHMERTLVETGADPKSLVLELSEKIFSNPAHDFTDTLRQLKAMGLFLAVDNFGTGSFSLTSLARLPFDRIKIDHSIMQQAVNHRRSAALVESILIMAKRLDMDAVAGGVECDEQMAFMSVKGCREMQGYYFGRPMKPLEMSSLMARSLESPLERLD